MATDTFERDDLELTLLRLFPPAIRLAVLDDKNFRDRLGLNVDAKIRFDHAEIVFQRSQLFHVLRRLLSGEISSANLDDSQGRSWNVAFDNESKRVCIKNEDRKLAIPDFSCLSSDSTKRLAWFDEEAIKFRVSDAGINQWRAILQERELEDEEVDGLFAEFRMTPVHFSAAVVHELQRETVNVKPLVPSDLRYYDRLVGKPTAEVTLKNYFDSVTPWIRQSVQQDPLAGLKDAFLLSSHPFGPQSIPLQEIPRETVCEVFQWLEANGDRVSQVGAIECGLAHVDAIPELEDSLTRLIRLVLSDDPNDKNGRLNLTCSLIVFVDGELARTGISRKLAPFWRRLASIAHASALERAIVGLGMHRSDFGRCAMQSRALLYNFQGFVDMRLEPRWNPDWILPAQLHAEFVGRLAQAAGPSMGKIKSPELRTLLNGDDASVRSKIAIPCSFLPGPLEGAVEPIVEVPREIEARVRASLGESELMPESFVDLVNSALIYRLGSPLPELAAEGLRRVKYQLRHIKSQDALFTLLSGLATVAAVTRSADLADGVRVLMRVVRHKAGSEMPQENAVRIALVAAAAHRDCCQWCRFVGDCITEFAFEGMGRDEALALRDDIRMLRELEPRLWSTTARADAAISAFIDSVPAEPV